MLQDGTQSKKVLAGDDGSIWVGYNVSQLPKRRNSAFGTLADAMKPRYYNEQFPYLCATLFPCALTGDFLEIFRRFEVVPFESRYILSVNQVDRWEMYECYTFYLCQALVKRVLTPVNFALPILPRRIGYCELEDTEAQVFSRARRARRAFCLLFGMATYLIALVPGWKAIAQAAEIPDYWLDGLEKSPVANFSIKEGRIGAFIDLSESSAELLNLRILIQQRIPLWIFWGDGATYRPQIQDRYRLRIAESFRPSAEEVSLAKGELQRVDECAGKDWPDYSSLPDYSTPWDFDFGLPISASDGVRLGDPLSSPAPRPVEHAESVRHLSVAESSPTVQPLPNIDPYTGYVSLEPGQVEKGSRQLPFETPQQFWERQHAEDEERLASMPAAERRRLTNERDGFHITKKSTVYHWEKFSWGYAHRRVSRKEFEDYSEYPLSQMRFSIARNEWDVCSDFDPDDDHCTSPEPDDDGCHFPEVQLLRNRVDQARRTERSRDETSFIPVPDISESDHVPVRADAPAPDEIAAIAKRFQDALKGRYTIRPEVKVRSLGDVALDKMLYYRYGLLLCNMRSLVPSGEDGSTVVETGNAWATTHGIFYDAESSIESFTIQEMLGITQFVSALLEGQPISPTVLDIHRENFDTPSVKEMQGVARTLHLQKCAMDRVLYLLLSGDLGFVFALEEPSLVVEILRRGVEALRSGDIDIAGLVRLFARRGSPFRSFCISMGPSIKNHTPDTTSWDLGFRSLDEEPGAYAYAQFEKLLQLFLRHPRSRRAFGLGGLIWRILMEVNGFGDIQIGPSEDTKVFGRCLKGTDGLEFWEDSLTESELLFLCGTYKVKKGQQVMYYSWWPSPKQWEAATSNVRYWSPGNERWFMTRLHDIRNGRATWVHTPKWTPKLKFNKKTKRVVEKNEDISEAFLNHLLSPY